MKCVLGFITVLDNKVYDMKRNNYKIPLFLKLKCSTSVPFRTLITKDQYLLPLRQTSKITTWKIVNKGKNQLNVAI